MMEVLFQHVGPEILILHIIGEVEQEVLELLELDRELIIPQVLEIMYIQKLL